MRPDCDQSRWNAARPQRLKTKRTETRSNNQAAREDVHDCKV
jgi:hypothetical protein